MYFNDFDKEEAGICMDLKFSYRRPPRKHFLWKKIAFLTLVFCVAGALSNFSKLAAKKNDRTSHRTEPDRLRYLRRLQSVEEEGDDNNTERECIPSTIDEFPEDVFTNEQRQKGAVALHFFIAIYMFIALALVCDDYFVSSLEKICEKLGFSEDVAGATFMAAGSSAPELFTSIIGVFIAEGDVGVGTIVGSAVFNILVIIGICAIFAGSVVPLTWWPMARDTGVYSLAVCMLIFVIHDGQVVWWEALIMLIMYIGYIFLMWLNPKLYLRVVKYQQERKAKKQKKQKDTCNNGKTAMQLEQAVPLNAPDEPAVVIENGASKPAVPMIDEYIGNSPKRLTFQDAGFRVMLSNKFPARTRMRTACWMIITEQRQMEKNNAEFNHYQNPGASSSTNGTVVKSDSFKKSSSFITVEEGDAEESGSHHIILGEPEGLCNIPDGCFGVFRWVLCLPLSVLLMISIPDCRRPRFEKFYLATFVMSIVWIMMFSYIMVWMVALIGYTMKIPDTIMGISFLAAGTSVPDAMASLIVARQGLGDMAVSNSIGSNVFDILLGLAFPWFLKTAITDRGNPVTINSKGLQYSVTFLLVTVFVTIASIHFFKWKLTRRLGFLLCAFYVVFLTLCSLVEFNIFGYVNPPICTD